MVVDHHVHCGHWSWQPQFCQIFCKSMGAWVQFHYDLYERLVFCSLFHVWVVTNIGVFEGPFHPGIF
jgi:hypothetical protein